MRRGNRHESSSKQQGKSTKWFPLHEDTDDTQNAFRYGPDSSAEFFRGWFSGLTRSHPRELLRKAAGQGRSCDVMFWSGYPGACRGRYHRQ